MKNSYWKEEKRWKKGSIYSEQLQRPQIAVDLK